MAIQTWQRFPIWNNWSSVTRFLNIACMAFESEHTRWNNSYTIKDPSKVILERVQLGKTFKIDLPIYLDFLQNQHLLCALILQYSHGLVEQHTKDVLTELHNRGKLSLLHLDPTGKNNNISELIENFTSTNRGIEIWGAKILQCTNRKWSDIKEGMKGLVEVAIIRNAIAHGKPTITTRMVNRASKCNLQLLWGLGDEVTLNIQILEEYRSRLRSSSRVIATGALT